MKKDFILSTTNSLEGYKIMKYHGVCSARLVVGVGLFSEAFAALTDVIGGRSTKFEERLNELYDQAVDKVKMSAIKKGANGLVGIKMDIDEINGKGTQMFMISVSGTAISAENLQENPGNLRRNEYVTLSGGELENHIRTKNNVMNLRNCNSHVNLYKIINASLNTKFPFPLDLLLNEINDETKAYTKIDMATNPFGIKELNESLNFYFSVVNRERYNEMFNDIIFNSERFTTLFQNIYSQYALPDYKAAANLIDKLPYEEVEKMLLPVLMKYGEQYDQESILDIDAVNERLGEIVNAKIVATKGTFNKEIWVCKCKKSISTSEERCPSCDRGRNGLSEDQEKQLNAIAAFLREIRETLRREL